MMTLKPYLRLFLAMALILAVTGLSSMHVSMIEVVSEPVETSRELVIGPLFSQLRPLGLLISGPEVPRNAGVILRPASHEHTPTNLMTFELLSSQHISLPPPSSLRV